MGEGGPDGQAEVEPKKTRDPEPSRGRLGQTLDEDVTEPETEKAERVDMALGEERDTSGEEVVPMPVVLFARENREGKHR